MQEGRAYSSELDRVAEQLALGSPEFRQRFLATSRTGSQEPLALLPRVFEDLRQGIMIVDRRFVVRHCSPRAAELLGRTVEDITNHSLTTCIDGVDLVTVKHECEKLTPGRGTYPPFITSWRIAPGTYEPRAVTIDPLRSGHQTVGYLISLSVVELVRGPRAVYQQLKAEKAGMDHGASGEKDEVPLTDEDAVSGDLHGTQITKREHEIILLILKQMTNREIAEHLNVAEVTVKKHLTSVYRKLRISTRRELALSFSRPGASREE
jgi:DNA-binding CsgD family transcriptional regulator